MTHTQPEGFLAIPPSSKGTGVLVLHAWWGLNETMKAFCTRLAESGFLVFALDHPELLAIEPDGKQNRQKDFDFLMSQEAKDIVKEEGMVLLDYRALQVIWREKSAA